MAHVQLSSGAMSFDFDDDMDGGPSVLTAATFLKTDEPTAAASSSNAAPIAEGGIAATPLPAKDLFARFNTAGKEMSADWLLVAESEPTNAGPLISADVLAKLKRKQEEHSMRGKTSNTATIVSPLTSPVGPAVTVAAAPSASAFEGVDGSEAEDATAAAPRLAAAGKRDREDDINTDVTNKSARPELPPLPSEAAAAGADGFVESGFGDSDYLNFGDLKNQNTSNLVLTAAVEAVEASEAAGKGGRRGVNMRGTAGGRNGAADLSAVSVPLWAAHRVRHEGGYCTENAAVALHQEVMDIVDFLRPTRSEVNMRRLIELEIQDICNRLFPYDGTEVCVYGSMSTHLMLPLSDLDMTILHVPVSTETALTRIAAEIGKLGLCAEAFPQLILKTKVPLVKFEHRMSGVKVDISINAGDGQVNSAIVKKLVGKFPEAKFLIMVVKYFLKQRDFDEPFKGGMGSFSTTLLVISFLQHHPIYNEDRDRRHLFGLGRLLVDFFRYYGNCFNFSKSAVVVGEGGCYYDRTRQLTDPNTGRPVQVIIEDPGNKNNNAASSLRNFPSIATSFEFAYLALTAVFDVSSQMSPDSLTIQGRPTLLSRILHVDAAMVHGRNVCAEGYRRWRASATKEERLRVKKFRFAEDVDMWDPFSTMRQNDSDAEAQS